MVIDARARRNIVGVRNTIVRLSDFASLREKGRGDGISVVTRTRCDTPLSSRNRGNMAADRNRRRTLVRSRAKKNRHSLPLHLPLACAIRLSSLRNHSVIPKMRENDDDGHFITTGPPPARSRVPPILSRRNSTFHTLARTLTYARPTRPNAPETTGENDTADSPSAGNKYTVKLWRESVRAPSRTDDDARETRTSHARTTRETR